MHECARKPPLGQNAETEPAGLMHSQPEAVNEDRQTSRLVLKSDDAIRNALVNDSSCGTGGLTLNQEAGGVKHLSLVAVRSARVRPSVVSGDAENGQAAVVYLQVRNKGDAVKLLFGFPGIYVY